MFHIYLRIFRPRGQRSSQLQVGQGRAHCCAETAKPTEKKPATSFCQPPSQLVVKTGREEEKTHSRLPVPCFIPHNWVFSWRVGPGNECNLQLHTRGDWKAQAQNEKLKSFGASFQVKSLPKLPTDSEAVEQSKSERQKCLFLLNKISTPHFTRFSFLV